MAKKIKDTDYLFLSTRVRALETQMLSRDRMEQMLEAKVPEDAASVLLDCGYGDIRLVAGNKKYADLLDVRMRPNVSTSSEYFVPGLLYTEYFQQNINILF